MKLGCHREGYVGVTSDGGSSGAIPLNQVSEWLGHKNPSTTLRIYAHVLGEAQYAAAIAHLNAIAPPLPPQPDPRLDYPHPPGPGGGLSGP